MMTTPLPENYEQWQHCITVECGIPLTNAFVQQRLSVWRNDKAEETVRFRKRYGDDYLRTVISWFEQAERKLAV